MAPMHVRLRAFLWQASSPLRVVSVHLQQAVESLVVPLQELSDSLQQQQQLVALEPLLRVLSVHLLLADSVHQLRVVPSAPLPQVVSLVVVRALHLALKQVLLLD